MAKPCKKEGCNNPRFGKGYCRYHQYLREDKKSSAPKKRSYIKPVSDNRAEELAIYRPRRDKYMLDNPKCECGCGRDSEDLHHKNGRRGKMVYNIKYFMAVARVCHTKIHENPEWAREKGYLI